MKKLFHLIVIILLVSCGNNSSNSNFCKELDRIKKEELPRQDVSVTSFAIDTLKNIRDTSGKKEIAANKEIGLLKGDKFNEADSLFLKLIDKEVITNPEEKKYISNIAKLKSIKLITCDSKNIHYKDIVDNKVIEFKLSLKKFDKETHTIKYIDDMIDENWCELIDGKEPWGGICGHPKSEVDKLEISVNGSQIEMKEELSDVFDFQMCDYDRRRIYFNPNPLLKYDEENKVFYLYIKGGNNADNYFGKFVFDEEKYITRYLLNYGQLSETSSFRLTFKGF